MVRPPSGSVGGASAFLACVPAAVCPGGEEEPPIRVHAPAAAKITARDANDASTMRRWRIARSRATWRCTQRGSPR